MSCTNPFLLLVADTRKYNIGQRQRLEKMGFKFSEDLNKAYKFSAKDSKNMPLEQISDWLDYRMIEVPCGSCLSCRLDVSADWAVRCQFEAQLYKHNYFVTLTYDDDHFVNGSEGNPTLVKEHIDKFIRAVRDYFHNRGHDGIRYLLCGEYNSSGQRILNPHYHMILFNCPIPDLTIDFPTPDGCIIHKYNKSGLPMFYSPLIDSIWSKGYITIDDANYNTEAYVSRYIMKKQKGDSAVFYDDMGVIAPFLRMSNRPGIGFAKFLQDKDGFIINPIVILQGNQKARVSGLPKYFKRKLFESNPELRPQFEDQAINKERIARSVRSHYRTTSNYQKAAKNSHIEKVTEVFDRSST